MRAVAACESKPEVGSCEKIYKVMSRLDAKYNAATHVQQHYGRIRQQFARNVGALFLAARQPAVQVVADLGVLAPGQLERVENIVHAPHLVGLGHFVGHSQHRRVRQGFAQCQLGKEDVLLQDVTDFAAPFLRYTFAVQPNAARIDGPLPAKRIQQCGFAASGWTHDGQHLAGSVLGYGVLNMEIFQSISFFYTNLRIYAKPFDVRYINNYT